LQNLLRGSFSRRLCASRDALILSGFNPNLARLNVVWSWQYLSILRCQKMSIRSIKSEKPTDKPMNIFEDLIEELKEENLIEQTVIETNRKETAFQTFSGDVAKKEDAAEMPPIETATDEISQLI